MGTITENQRRIYGGRLQKKRTKMGTTSQVEGRGMEGRNGNERKSTYEKIRLKKYNPSTMSS